MTNPIPALSSAVNAMRVYSRRADQAAERIARAGLDVVPPDAPPGTPAAEPPAEIVDLGEAMVSLMIAQRAFSAQLRVIETADQMTAEAVQLGRRPG